MEKTLKINLEKHPELKLAHGLVCNMDNYVIAGGAPRDLINNKPLSDVDVFAGVSCHGDLLERADYVTSYFRENNVDYKMHDGYWSDGDANEAIEILARISGGNIDVCFIKTSGDSNSTEEITVDGLFKQFDLVSSEAWLEKTDDGFNAHSTDLFKALNEKKVLGYYSGNTYHLSKIKDKYSDYLPLSLNKQPLTVSEDSRTVPF